MEEKTPVLLVTANVGSIFEDPDSMLQLWVQEFLQIIVRVNAKFIALHCQEVGGKNYETRMQHVDNFVKMLISSDEFKLYDKAEIFLDEDFSCAENFTALGNFYFIHETVKDILIWNFQDLKFQSLNGKNVHSGNIESVPIKEKSKFPQNFFPECKWSRKGYLRTRWSINGTVLDLVNIHLFHDASNFVAMQSYPSVYTLTRQKALQYTLNRFYNDEERSAPFFLFGDFNFRTDTRGVIKKLTSGLNECKDTDANNDDCKVEFKDNDSEVVVTIGKKEFCHTDHQNVFVNDAGEWLKEYDREMDAFKDQLFEFPVTFLPSYPFEENCMDGQAYMKTRCPAWCDRVLLSVTAKQLVSDVDSDNIEYSVIGKERCMGDHKPVYLFVNLINGAGIIQSQLPFRKVCSACKLNCSALCETINDSPAVALKSHASGSDSRYDVTSAALPCTSCKKHTRNPSRSADATSPQTSSAEQSDRVSDQTVEKESYSSAVSNLTTANSAAVGNGVDANCHSSYFSVNPSLDEDGDSRFAGDDNVSLHHFCESSRLQSFVSRSFDEGGVTVRSNSVSAVAEASWRCKTCVCLQENVWRVRSVSTSSRASSWTSETRMRLKSDPNLKTSLPRIQSHHSSSDEEWFEEVGQPADEKHEKLSGAGDDRIEFEAEGDVAGEPSPADPLTAHQRPEKRGRRRYFLFCIPTRWGRQHGGQKSMAKNRTYFRFLSSKNRKCRLCCLV